MLGIVRRFKPLAYAAVVAAAVAAAGVVATASPVYAVTGLRYVTGGSAFDSASPKTVLLSCPSGTVAINGGGYLTGAVGNAAIRQIAPLRFFGASMLSVVAEEDADGYLGSWSVKAIAVCITPPPGFAYVSRTLSDPSYVWTTASCGGKRVIGSGYSVSTTALAKAAGAEIDSRNRAYLSVEASPLPNAVRPITGTVIAACADTALPGMQWFKTTSVVDSTDGKTAITYCPGRTHVIGVGGDLYRWRHHTVIDDFTIVPGTNSVRVTGFEDEIGNPDPWAVDSYAVCAT